MTTSTDLTERERQVIVALADGLTYSAIGERLYISEATVKTMTQSVYRKFGVNNSQHAVMVAVRRGILDSAPDMDVGAKVQRSPIIATFRSYFCDVCNYLGAPVAHSCGGLRPVFLTVSEAS